MGRENLDVVRSFIRSLIFFFFFSSSLAFEEE